MSELARVAQLAARLPAELQTAQQRGIRVGALAVTREIRSEIRSATGGDSRLSGVGRSGARVGARFDVKGSTNPTALVSATGPIQLIERDTRPHTITPKRRRRGGKARALRMADGRYAAHATHPGTRGKEPFARGVEQAKDEPGKALDREVQAAIKRVLA